MWFAMMWLGWDSLSHVPDATARQQQKQLQQQRHEQQMLRQQRLFEGAFGAASDRHGGHVNHPFTLLSWKLVVSLLPWQNRGYGWSESFSGFKLSPYGAIAVESLQESMSFSKSSYFNISQLFTMTNTMKQTGSRPTDSVKESKKISHIIEVLICIPRILTSFCK